MNPSLHTISTEKSQVFKRRRKVIEELKACTSSRNVGRGKYLHELARQCGDESNAYVASTLINMYTKCGRMEDARAVFDSLEQQNVVSWTALILGYADNRQGDVALELFARMGNEGCCAPDARVFLAALKACANIAQKDHAKMTSVLVKGKKIHLLVFSCGCDSDKYVQSTLIDMFCKCNCMDEARKVFEALHEDPDVVLWTSLILGYVENGEGDVALELLSQMVHTGCTPDAKALVCALKASVIKESFCEERGKMLHLLAAASGCDTDNYVQSALVDMYAKCGKMKDASEVFNRLKCPDVVCWTALISGYAENGDGDAALEHFSRMKREGTIPNEVTFVAVLKACGMLAALEIGKETHAEICNRGFEHDEILANSLLGFYANCGNMADAERVFSSHPKTSLITWNALMAGYTSNGDIECVINLFNRMQDAGAGPDALTFISILTACSQAGLVDHGKKYFEAMTMKYGINPVVEHYSCMISLCSCSKVLDEAMMLLRSMPFDPTAVIWTTVLEACKRWKYMELGKLAFESVIVLECRDAGAYVLMASVYGTRVCRQTKKVKSSVNTNATSEVQ